MLQMWFCVYEPDQGWEKNEEGFLEPVWPQSPILTPFLIDLLGNVADEQEEEAEDELGINFDEFLHDN